MLPSNGQPVTGQLDVKVYPPYHPTIIYAWVEEDRSEQVVWMGSLVPESNYTVKIDTSKFRPGKHRIKALYYMYGEDVEGDIDIWVNSP